jgi:hypothetical protein
MSEFPHVAGEGCVFRQLYNDPERVPDSMTSALSILSGVQEEDITAGDTAEALSALEAPACPVDGCRLSIRGLLTYVTGAGADVPRQELDEVVAPGCAILDVPHQIDTDFGSFYGDPGNPLA